MAGQAWSVVTKTNCLSTIFIKLSAISIALIPLEQVFVCLDCKLYISSLRLGYISCIMRPVRSLLCWEWFVIKATAGQCPGQPFSHCRPAGPTTPATRQGSPPEWPLSTSYNWTALLNRNSPPANYQVKRRRWWSKDLVDLLV